jgi:peptidyl-prolyl cis-trans isomerase D
VFGNKKVMLRIVLGIVVGVLAVSMLLYLVPQGTSTGGSPDAVAEVGDQAVTVAEVRAQLRKMEQRSQVPRTLEPFYAQQILQDLVFQKELEYEAKRLDITVDDAELAERIHRILPDSYSGGTFVGMPRYVDEVRTRFDMSVGEFEDVVRQGLLEEKFRRLVTDGVSTSPAELQEEFLRRNEKVKLEYTLIKPQDLEANLSPGEADLTAYYQKNSSRYVVPERRIVRYALLDINQLREHLEIGDATLRAIYQQNIARYQVPNRVHVEHILFKTIGKTDAEVAEIQKRAEDVLKQAKKKGADFEALAKQNSEDTATKDKGGDLGWIVQGQTTPEFEKAAFGLPKGAVSDLVRTPYGFHIIKVLDRENAHTKPFEEVRDSIRTPLLLQEVDQEASDTADKIAVAVGKSSRGSLDDLAKQFHLTVGETRPLGAGDPILELGNSKEVRDAILERRPGELTMPIHTDRGYVVLSVKEIQPAHQGTFAEVRDRVMADWKKERAAELARSKAAELAKRLQAGEGLQDAAKALGLEAKTSEALTRNERIPDTGSSRPLVAAFNMTVGQSSPPLAADSGWVVFRVKDKLEPDPDDYAKQNKELGETVLERKRELAFEAFRAGLEARLRQEGKLKLKPDLMTSSFGKIGG